MANLDFYKRHFNISSVDALCAFLCDTFIETNHTYDFFVNWSKVTQNRDAFKYELALLKSIHNSHSPKSDFTKLIKRYPEVVKVIPILLASRENMVNVLDALEPHIQYKTFDFSKSVYVASEVDKIVEFTEKTGLLHAICHMESATDYALGVEVGLDTNARKNRSGLFLEKMIREVANDLVKRNRGLVWLEQKDFAYVQSTFGIEIPPSLKDRKFDGAVINENKAFNIEVNFYGGTGSKPSEIVSSYINRCEVLSSAGWKFVWLTDGKGWKSMQSPLRVGVEHIDYVINANLLRQGILEKIIFAT